MNHSDFVDLERLGLVGDITERRACWESKAKERENARIQKADDLATLAKAAGVQFPQMRRPIR